MIGNRWHAPAEERDSSMRASILDESDCCGAKRSSSAFSVTASIAIAAAAFAAAFAAADVTVAQQGAPNWQTSPPPQQTRPTPPQQPQQQTARPKQPAKQSDPTAAGTSGTESALRQRVEQLEEQLVDLQVIVGTVESLARAGGASSASSAYRGGAPVTSGGGSGADTGRVAALETQVQALTSQLDQMSQQIRQLQSGSIRGPSGPAPRIGASGGGFGTPTVTPADDPIANIINAPDQRGATQRGAQVAMNSAEGRQQYDQAYSQLLQQNYPAAEVGFSEFLQRFPNDELTPNAQFWLGETYFVRGQWDSAAASFLKVAQSHPRSDKAPDSLAKFAMAMERKGNKPAACRALQELNARYPNPPAHVRSWETAERRRAGCT